MSKLLSGIIGCKDQTCSWHLSGFPDGSNIGWVKSTMSERISPLYCTLTSIAMQVTRHIVCTEQGKRTMELLFFMGLVTPPIHFGIGHTVRME